MTINGVRYVQALLAAILVFSAGAATSAQAETARGWLERMGPAMTLTAYRGVFVYARGDLVHTMQIAHRYHNDRIEERLVQQDGANGEFLRLGDEVLCILPDQSRVRLDEVVPSGAFTKPLSEQQLPDDRWYQASIVGDDRVAGHGAVKIALEARDQHRHSYRFWLDKNTGLLLKSHIRGASGDVLDRFQFTSLEIRESLPDSEFVLQQDASDIEHWRLGEKSAFVRPSAGWRMGWRPDGFEPAASPRSGGGQAVAFSDGLATFSVFVEPVDVDAMPSGASRIGATTAYMKHVDLAGAGFLITVVGEIPPATAMRIAESVELNPDDDSGSLKP